MPPARRACLALFVAVFALATLALVLSPTPAHAAAPNAAAQATDTPTPTATATPNTQISFTLDSGNEFQVQRTWTFGELGIMLTGIVGVALYGLHFLYELAGGRRK